MTITMIALAIVNTAHLLGWPIRTPTEGRTGVSVAPFVPFLAHPRRLFPLLTSLHLDLSRLATRFLCGSPDLSAPLD